eukprot:gene10845-biopygen7471
MRRALCLCYVTESRRQWGEQSDPRTAENARTAGASGAAKRARLSAPRRAPPPAEAREARRAGAARGGGARGGAREAKRAQPRREAGAVGGSRTKVGAKRQNGALLGSSAPLCPPPSAQPRLAPVSTPASAAGFLRQGVSGGEWEDAPPTTISVVWNEEVTG